MTPVRAETSAEPFFLKSGTGQRFCLFHRPAGSCRGAVLYVHPFAEELNRSRRMAALQARTLAAQGYGVLQIDLYGCGDSSGDFGDARWELWKQDLAAGAAWLCQQLDQPVTLWGLRLGATLALDYARSAAHPIAAMILWQPVLNGAVYLTQFLRLRMASALLADAASAQTGTGALREALRAGETLEIGGYDLAPALAAALDALDPVEALAPACPVYWLEAVNAPGQALPPAAARVSAEWQRHGVDLDLRPVHCPPFWTTSEITVCQGWLDATMAALQVSVHES
jgi:exosortase A-associated hydrolase 2